MSAAPAEGATPRPEDDKGGLDASKEEPKKADPATNSAAPPPAAAAGAPAATGGEHTAAPAAAATDEANPDEIAAAGPYHKYDPTKPEFLALPWYDYFEMLERRNETILEEQFGGMKNLVETHVKSNIENGIDPSTYQARIDQFGENLLSVKEPARFIDFLLHDLQERVVLILIGASIISVIFGTTLPNPNTGVADPQGGWISGVAIIISVVIVVLTQSINNYQKAKQFEEMEKEQAIKEWQIIRGGAEHVTPSNLVVVGDILRLEYGMELMCDGIVIEASDLKINESSLTGEPDLIHKNVGNFVISGTSVEEGSGKIVILAIGMDTQQGRSKKSVEEEAKETPLTEHMDELTEDIGKFGFAAAILLVVALSIKEAILVSTTNKFLSPASFLGFFLTAVAVVTVAIPEGLHLAVTIALAYAMKALMKDNCMVRVLASCETMGAATTVCSDKTGTLTTNTMTLVQLLIAEEEMVLDKYGIVPRSGADVTLCPRESVQMKTLPKTLGLFTEALALNSAARQSMIEGELRWVGNKTDQGMLRFLPLVGVDYMEVRNRYKPEDVRQFPFNSGKKRMTTLARQKDGSVTVFTKGASEIMLESCSKFMTASGDIAEITAEKRDLFNTIIVDMANQGNRTIGLAATFGVDIPGAFPEEEPSGEEFELVFLGVCGIQDPIRPEVPDAVAMCHKAGLVVRMVTGDNINTAIAIGTKCGLYVADGFDIALEGPTFRRMAVNSRDELLAMLPRMKIMARCSPTDKLTLVGLLQELGETVGVTGDGTNDAPALKAAHVGFAMKTGTDIAKSAAHMILLDDNFATVVSAIRWGRAVNDNIKRFLQFQLAINCSGVLLTLVGSIASPTSKEPFTPVQLLWLNLIMDTLAALALATEAPATDILDREPVYKQAAIVTNNCKAFIVVHGTFQFVLMMVILFLGQRWFETYDHEQCNRDFPKLSRIDTVNVTNSVTNVTTRANVTVQYEDPIYTECARLCKFSGGVMDGRYCQQGIDHSTMIFNIFIWFQVFNVVNGRKIYGELNPFEGLWTRSRQCIVIFGIIALFQLFAVEVTGQFMRVRGLSARHWGICIGFGALELVVGFLMRLVPIKDGIPEEVKQKHRRMEELREDIKAGRNPLKRRSGSMRRTSVSAH